MKRETPTYQGRHRTESEPWTIRHIHRVAAVLTCIALVSVSGVGNLTTVHATPDSRANNTQEVVTRSEAPSVLYEDPVSQQRRLMTIHDDARAAAESVYDTELTNRWNIIRDLQGQLLQMTAERDAALTRAETAETQVQQLEQQVAELEAKIKELEEQAPPPLPPPGPITPRVDGLWFDPETHLQRHPANPNRILVGHYVPWAEITRDNQPMTYDTYSRAYFPVNGESGKHAVYGGYARDFGANNAPYLGVSGIGAGSWRRVSQADDIKNAIKYGLDGFFVDIVNTNTSSTSGHWPAIATLIDEASANFPGFFVAPMVDTSDKSSLMSTTTIAIASHINLILNKQSAWRLPDGRYVVGAFRPEGKTATWWHQLASELEDLGKDVAFVGAFNDIGDMPEYRDFLATGAWSPGADPAILQGRPSGVIETRQRGQTPLIPLLGQNVRPNQGWYDEARGFSALDHSWDQIIAEGDVLVQMVTWNDWAEGSAVALARKKGSTGLSYSLWRALEWKTGVRPIVQQDSVLVAYRNQMLDAQIIGGQTRFMVPAGTIVDGVRRGPQRPRQTASVNEVEIRTILTREAEVTVRISGIEVGRFTAGAGEFIRYVPARTGLITVTLSTGLTVAPPIPIRNVSGNDDREWVMYRNGEYVKVFDPTPLS